MKEVRRITVTTTKRRILRYQPQALSAFCPGCAREVEMLTSAQAAGVLEVDEQTFERLVSSGWVHTIQTLSGVVWVCKDSLFTK